MGPFRQWTRSQEALALLLIMPLAAILRVEPGAAMAGFFEPSPASWRPVPLCSMTPAQDRRQAGVRVPQEDL